MRTGLTYKRPMLLLFRVDPDRLEKILPLHARPRTLYGQAMLGILLRRQRDRLGTTWPGSLTGAERMDLFANVSWCDAPVQRPGVFVLRSDTSSRWHVLLGQCTPGPTAHHARIRVEGKEGAIEVRADSDDGAVHLGMSAHCHPAVSPTSIFGSPSHAMNYLRQSLVHLKALDRHSKRDMGYRKPHWRLQPLQADQLEADIRCNDPQLSAADFHFDSAFFLRFIEPVWSEQEAICYDGATV